MAKFEQIVFPTRKGITILGPDDPNKRKICPPMIVLEGDMVRIFPKDDDSTIETEELDPIVSRFEILDPIVSRFEILDL